LRVDSLGFRFRVDKFGFRFRVFGFRVKTKKAVTENQTAVKQNSF
jgi:hypothetical protein